MRILGKAFISEKVENTQIVQLRIAGINEGIARMLSVDPEAQSSTSPFDSVRAELNMEETVDE